LWDNNRSLMVEIRESIYNTISNMTVLQANDIARIITRQIENIIITAGLNSYAIAFLSRWVYVLHRVYSDGSIPFPVVDSSYTTMSIPIGTRLRARFPSLMQYISSSAAQYADLVFNTLDERFLYLSNTCRTIAIQARHVAHSHVWSEEEKEYIRQELAEGLDLSVEGLRNRIWAEDNLGNPVEQMEFATVLYNNNMWAPFENAFLPSNEETLLSDPAYRNYRGFAESSDSMLTTLNTRRASNYTGLLDDNNSTLFSERIQNVNAEQIFLPPRTVLRNYLTTIRIPEDVIEILMEDLSDQQVEEALADFYAGRTVNVIRENTQPPNISMYQLLNESGGRLNPEQFERFREALTMGTSAPYRGMGAEQDTQLRQDGLSARVMPDDYVEITRRYARLGLVYTGGSDARGGMTGDDEVALTSQGVCNLNDLANAHPFNKNPQVEFEKIKVASEQEIWEGLQKNHAGMMETIQYILDDCTIDYKETNKTKRIDKMKNEMLPRIKGVLTCMNDRLIPDEVHYINKWLWDLINFAINCNQPLPYRRLAPNINNWNKEEEPRIKRIHTALHIPRLSE
jgi:hypothetical protein